MSDRTFFYWSAVFFWLACIAIGVVIGHAASLVWTAIA